MRNILQATLTLFFLLMSASCGYDNGDNTFRYDESYVDQLGDCGNDGDFDVYRLSEKYFKKDEKLLIRTRIVYFVNGAEKPLSNSTLRRRNLISNQYFLNGKLSNSLEEVIYIEGKPETDSTALSNISALELIQRKKRKDLRNKYYIEHYDFWNEVYGKEGYINIYIYDNCSKGFSGVAGGIGSTYFAIRTQFTSPYYHTWEHELGHCYGLYHTHQRDNTDGLNSDTGDRVCDTYTSIDTLFTYVNDTCGVKEGCPIPNEHTEALISNMMSYTNFVCRANFSKEQIRRKRKIIETNADLRRTIIGFDEDFTLPPVVTDRIN